MNTVQIEKSMKTNKYTQTNFKGVFASDKLPNVIRKKPCSIIANTDESNKPGQHWVAFFIPKSGAIEFFDSVGRKPGKSGFIKFITDNGREFVYSKKRLQGTFSTTCGYYATMYLLARSRNISRRKFFNMFSTDLSENDEKIQNLFRKNFSGQKNQTGSNSMCINQYCQPCP